MRETKNEIIDVEQVTWRDGDIDAFAMTTFDRFSQEFRPPYVGTRGHYSGVFAYQLNNMGGSGRAEIEFQNGMSFSFVRFPHFIARNEFYDLIDTNGFAVEEHSQPPIRLADGLYFQVRVSRFRGDNNALRAISGFFSRLKNDGRPIEHVEIVYAPKDGSFKGDVYANLDRDYFQSDVVSIQSEVQTPRMWARTQLEVGKP